jgi:hypothetical protein
MRPREDSRPGALQLQAIYSIATLARFANVTPYLLRRVLRANGIEFVRGGRAVFVPLTEIQRKLPSVWESICTAERVRQGRARRRSR